jgi:hypothetical protein
LSVKEDRRSQAEGKKDSEATAQTRIILHLSAKEKGLERDAEQTFGKSETHKPELAGAGRQDGKPQGDCHTSAKLVSSNRAAHLILGFESVYVYSLGRSSA